MRSRAARGQGPLLVANDWRASGAGEDRALLDEVDWLAQAQQLLRKRFGNEAPTDRMEWTRRALFLQRRGYPAELIRNVLKNWEVIADGD
jgi:regulatory protein